MSAIEQCSRTMHAVRRADTGDFAACKMLSTPLRIDNPRSGLVRPPCCFLAAALAIFFVAMPACAGLLAEGQTIRVIPFGLRDADKPMIEATIAGKQGMLMFDNGTPDMLFLNRGALDLPGGRFVARGFAASGQPIEVQAHTAPRIDIHGQPLTMPGPVRSGDFAFTAPALGNDFLGFIGTKMVEGDAFVLDYARRILVVLKAGKDGSLPVASPKASDVAATVRFLIWPGEQPTIAASLGSLPIVTDFDTGDSGTLYVTAASQEMLRKQKILVPRGGRWRLHGLTVGGVVFNPTTVRVVEAGGSRDFRTAGPADQLRLGASFLAANPCLWNFPARTLTFLKPDAAFLSNLADPGDQG